MTHLYKDISIQKIIIISRNIMAMMNILDNSHVVCDDNMNCTLNDDL